MLLVSRCKVELTSALQALKAIGVLVPTLVKSGWESCDSMTRGDAIHVLACAGLYVCCWSVLPTCLVDLIGCLFSY